MGMSSQLLFLHELTSSVFSAEELSVTKIKDKTVLLLPSEVMQKLLIIAFLFLSCRQCHVPEIERAHNLFFFLINVADIRTDI